LGAPGDLIALSDLSQIVAALGVAIGAIWLAGAVVIKSGNLIRPSSRKAPTQRGARESL
jgi:hypothetical protein